MVEEGKSEREKEGEEGGEGGMVKNKSGKIKERGM